MNGLRWVFAEAPPDLAAQYGIRSQSSWAAIGADGVIVGNRGPGAQDEDYWRGVLDQLRGA